MRIYDGLWKEIIVTLELMFGFFFNNSMYIKSSKFCLCIFVFEGFSVEEGSKFTSNLIFNGLTVTYYEVLVSGADQYFFISI